MRTLVNLISEVSVIIVLICINIHHVAEVTRYKYGTEVMDSIVAVRGALAKLPCDITPSFPNDEIHLVIWFKENQNGKLNPIYTFDNRGDKVSEQEKYWSSEAIFGRVHFRVLDKLTNQLTIDSVLEDDAGVYQCRVDFKQSPTKFSKLNLTVIIPPNKLTVFDGSGKEVVNYSHGPYLEGIPINITCVSFGGIPLPKVTWWQENALLDDSYENISRYEVRNILYIERLQRKHSNIELTCQASNNEVLVPISTSLWLDLILRPLSVNILGENRPLSAKKEHGLQCQIVGARPTPTIFWWKSNSKMNAEQAINNVDSNTTISTIQFTPSLYDDGKVIYCTAEHSNIPGSEIESDRWKLKVKYVPVATLTIGKKSHNGFQDGSDVYFECNIKSNPWYYKILWKHNEKILNPDTSSNIIINNQSLILLNVTRKNSGFYKCAAINEEGLGESNQMDLQINYRPICRIQQSKTYTIALGSPQKIICNVESNPEIMEFSWTLNDTTIYPHVKYINQTTNIITYTPKNINEYGMLFCKGINSVGQQLEPCTFHLVLSEKFAPLSNCSVLNQTYHTSIVKCAQHIHGEQTFFAEIYDIQTRTLLQNISSNKAEFAILGLNPGLKIEIIIFAVTELHKSEGIHLYASFPPSDNNNYINETSVSVPVRLSLTPTLSVTIGVVFGLILMIVAAFTICRCQRKNSIDERKYDDEGLSAAVPRCNTTSSSRKIHEGDNENEKQLRTKQSDTYIKLETQYEMLKDYRKAPECTCLLQEPSSNIKSILKNNPEVSTNNSSDTTAASPFCGRSDFEENILQLLVVQRNGKVIQVIPQQEFNITQL